MKYKYVITDNTNPYMNLAMEQDLFRYAVKDTTILYLWQNDDTIVIGKNQNVYSECRTEEFRKSGGRIARRMSGGGAVYHDLGNLNFSIINLKNDNNKPGYQEIIKIAMCYLGIETEFNGRNDLLVDGKKFSGNAFYDDGTVFCQHGTILISANINRMTFFLTPEASKLERNHVKSVESRVVNLNEMSSDINVSKMKTAIIESLDAEKLDYVPDQDRLKKLYDKFTNQEWIYGEGIK